MIIILLITSVIVAPGKPQQNLGSYCKNRFLVTRYSVGMNLKQGIGVNTEILSRRGSGAQNLFLILSSDEKCKHQHYL